MEQQVQYRSQHCSTPVRAFFQNSTGRTVDIIWADYNGAWIRYSTIKPGENYNIETFVTHPWIFRDQNTGMLLSTLNRGKVYIPSNADVLEAESPEGEVFLLPKVIIITLPVLTLKERCIEAIGSYIKDKNKVQELEIPEILRADILSKLENYGNQEIRSVYEMNDVQGMDDEEIQEMDDQ